MSRRFVVMKNKSPVHTTETEKKAYECLVMSILDNMVTRAFYNAKTKLDTFDLFHESMTVSSCADNRELDPTRCSFTVGEDVWTIKAVSDWE